MLSSCDLIVSILVLANCWVNFSQMACWYTAYKLGEIYIWWIWGWGDCSHDPILPGRMHVNGFKRPCLNNKNPILRRPVQILCSNLRIGPPPGPGCKPGRCWLFLSRFDFDAMQTLNRRWSMECSMQKLHYSREELFSERWIFTHFLWEKSIVWNS